jgi:hypothetical protein
MNLLRPEIRLQSLRGREHVFTDRLAVQAGVDRQDIVQQIRDSAKRQVGRPLGLQEFELRRDVRSQYLGERTEGCFQGPRLTGARVPARALQRNVTEGCPELQRVITLECPWLVTNSTGAPRIEKLSQLTAHNVILEGSEQSLGFAEAREPD